MEGQLTRVQRRQRQTQERIFRAAMDLFQRKGFENTSIAEITAAADIGKGTFFTYFPTKEAIFGHLGAMLTQTMAETVDTALRAGLPAPAVLEQLFEGAARWHEANRHLSAPVILAGLRDGSAMAADLPNQQRFRQILAALVRAGQERGELQSAARPDDAATALGGIYFATLLAWIQAEDGRLLAERLHASLGLLMQGLRP